MSCSFIVQQDQSNELELKGSRTQLLENSIATACICAFSHLSVPYACCYWFTWIVFYAYPSVFGYVMFALSISHTDVIVGLLINSSMYIRVRMAFVLFFLMLNDNRSFPFFLRNPFDFG